MTRTLATLVLTVGLLATSKPPELNAEAALFECIEQLAYLSDGLDPLLYEPEREGDLERCRAAVLTLLPED